MRWSLLVLLVLTCCSPAYAEPAKKVNRATVVGTVYELKSLYDSRNQDNRPMTITFIPQEEYYGDVVFKNELVMSNSPTVIEFQLPDGLSITVILESGPGDIPDDMEVIPPPGFYTIPDKITVEEGEDGKIEIHEMLLG